MELNYLKDFITLAQIHHFQEAADMLYISQSTLSKHIKAIEAELGQELFIRSRKRSELSDFGKRFLPYAQQLLDIQQEYTDILLNESTDKNHVSFGNIPMVTLYNFMKFFTGYLKENPSVQYNIVQGSSERLLSLLKEKKLDFILTDDIPLPQDEYQKVLYTRDCLVAILPVDHPLAAQEYVNIKDLENETLIAYTDLVDTEHYLHRLYPDLNFQMSISVEKEVLLFDLIRSGFGISILTKWSSKHHSAEGTVVKEIYPKSVLNLYMIYQKNRNLHSMTTSFASYLTKRNEKFYP